MRLYVESCLTALLLFSITSGYALSGDVKKRLDTAKWHSQSGDHKTAAALLQANLADPEVQRDDYMAGICVALLGAERRSLGDPDKAIEDETAALVRFERAGDKGQQRSCHLEIARSWEQLGKLLQAVGSYRRAVALDEEGELDTEKAQDLKSLAQIQEKAGDLPGALKTWQELLRQEEHEKDVFKQGECRLKISRVYNKLGDSVAAAEYRKEGQRLQEQAELDARGANESAVFNKLSVEAQQRLNSGDINGAYKGYEAMLSEARKRGFKNGMGFALRTLGSLDSNAGRHASALRNFEECARVAHEAGEGTNEVGALIYLGVVLSNSGEIAAGLARLEQSSLLAGAIGDTAGEVESLRNMRIIYSMLGDFPKVLSVNAHMLEKAESSKRKRLMIQAEGSVCHFYEEIGDNQTAVEHCRRGLELAEKLGDREVIADSLNEYGVALMNMGEQDAAITALRRSVSIKDWGGGHVNIAEALLYKGELEEAAMELRPMGAHHIDMGYYYLMRGHYDHARENYRRVLSRDMNENKTVTLAFASRTGIALAYEGLRDYYKAAYHFKEAEKLLERQRDSLSLAHRLFFLGVADWMIPHIEPYEGMVRISEFLPGGARESLYHAEFTRGRLFAESAARNYSTPDMRLPAKLADRELLLNQAVSSAAARAEAANRSTDHEAYLRFDHELSELNKKRKEFVEELRLEYPESAAMRYPEPLHVEEFALEPGEVLIEFEVTRLYTRVFVVKDRRVALNYNVMLSRDELSELVKTYRAFFEGVSGTTQLADFDPKIGERLYKLLLKPALEAVENGVLLVPVNARLIVAPDEILSILPFESLITSLPDRLQSPAGRFGPAPVGVSYVADKYDIAYAHSATALTVQRRLKAKKVPSRGLLVLADPIFDITDSRLLGTALAKATLNKNQVKTMGGIAATMGLAGKRRGTMNGKTIGKEDSLFPRLDKTGLLASALRDNIFRGQSSEVLIGSLAAKNELLSRDLSDYRYLVIATHGILDNMVPGLREPALVLNQVGNPDGDNGLLTMSEVMRLRLNADVVALTACQTGMGRHLTGEGVMGLGRAFQYAGARNVLVSLWNVSEGSTTMLAERFFNHLKQGKTMRQALRLARTDVRRAGYEHPFYWAPFILIGE